MTISEQNGETYVQLTDYTGTRAKALFSFEALSYAGGTVALVIATCAAIASGALLMGLLSAGATVVFIIALRRYFNRVTGFEELVIKPDALILINNRGRKRNTVGYPIDEIEDLHYIGFEKPVDHPLKTLSFDYIGLQTQQEVVNAVMAEGNIGFEWKGQKIRFGIGVPSWEAEELNALFLEKTGGRLFIDGLPEDIPEYEWNNGKQID